MRNGSHPAELIHRGVLHIRVPLGYQENFLTLHHGLFQGRNGFFPPHVKMQNHVREYHQSPQGQYRHGNSCRFFLSGHSFLLQTNGKIAVCLAAVFPAPGTPPGNKQNRFL